MKSLGELAELLDAELFGDPAIPIEDAKTTVRAGRSDITFACSDKHVELFLQLDSPAAIVPKSLVNKEQLRLGKAFLEVDDAETSFEKVVRSFRPLANRERRGISDRAIISDSAVIAEDVEIQPGAFLGERVHIGCGSKVYANATIMDGVTIGANTTIFPNVVLYENTVVGDRCLIHGGAVIGAYGFGYKSTDCHRLSAQLGNVVIGNDVEVGSNTTIDRGTYDSTTIGDGTKLDDLVMIGHNCQIGKHNLLCSQVGIAGSTITGDFVVMAGQVGLGDHLEIGNKVTIAAQSGVMHNLSSDQVYLGSPAVPVREQMQIHANLVRLPEMRKQIRRMQKMLDQLPSGESQDLANEAA